jgi:hypothetical protein
VIIDGSIREKYILAQALTIAIKQLEAVEPRVMRELSNIADMRAILEENMGIFNEPFFKDLEEHSHVKTMFGEDLQNA